MQKVKKNYSRMCLCLSQSAVQLRDYRADRSGLWWPHGSAPCQTTHKCHPCQWQWHNRDQDDPIEVGWVSENIHALSHSGWTWRRHTRLTIAMLPFAGRIFTPILHASTIHIAFPQFHTFFALP